MRHPKKLGAGLGVITAGLLATGVAYAAWTSTGAGTGTAKSTTSINSVIAGTDGAADLFPGATSSVTVTISNPNDYPVEVTSISAGSSRAVNGCAADTVRSTAVAAAANGAVAKIDGQTSIPAKGSGSYALEVKMSNSATDACKSQTFTLGLGGTPASDMTATLRSAATANGF